MITIGVKPSEKASTEALTPITEFGHKSRSHLPNRLTQGRCFQDDLALAMPGSNT